MILITESDLITGKGRILVRKSGMNKKTRSGGYEYVYLSIPSKIAKDRSFPFANKELVSITLSDGNITVKKRNPFLEMLKNFGFDNATLPKLIELKAKENKGIELKKWKQLIDEVVSPPQLSKLVKEVEELNNFKTKAVTVFAVVQFGIACMVVISKLMG